MASWNSAGVDVGVLGTLMAKSASLEDSRWLWSWYSAGVDVGVRGTESSSGTSGMDSLLEVLSGLFEGWKSFKETSTPESTEDF